jgi:hypothetical protein
LFKQREVYLVNDGVIESSYEIDSCLYDNILSIFYPGQSIRIQDVMATSVTSRYHARSSSVAITIPQDSKIKCAKWLNDKMVCLGLNNGDIIVGNTVSPENSFVLSDRKGLKTFWSGLIQPIVPAMACSQVVAISSFYFLNHLMNPTAHSDGHYLPYVVSVDTKGILRIWNVVTQKCLTRLSSAAIYKSDPAFQNCSEIFVKGKCSKICF